MMAHCPYKLWQGWQGPVVLVSRLFWCALAWWVLTEGAADAWVVGVPAVVVAALLSTLMLPRLRWSWQASLRFAGFFLMESLRGGIDVAMRALHWRLPLDPGIVRYRVALALPAARVSMANTASLLPGTLIADLDEEYFYVHALDAGREISERLTKAEHRVADLYSEPMLPAGARDAPEAAS